MVFGASMRTNRTASTALNGKWWQSDCRDLLLTSIRVVSILWQVIFAYGTGFVLLREIRHVKDVYHW